MINNTPPQLADSKGLEAEQQRLIQAAQKQITEKAGMKRTNRFNRDAAENLPSSLQGSLDGGLDHPELYTPVPQDLLQIEGVRTLCWRVEMHGLLPGVGPLGFDILGDVILGRGADVVRVDIDLEPYRAAEKGVSRQHALLRPTTHALYLFDLSSTNGTQCNGIQLGAGVARVLSQQDTIRLGHFTFEIKVIDGPGMRRPQEAHSA